MKITIELEPADNIPAESNLPPRTILHGVFEGILSVRTLEVDRTPAIQPYTLSIGDPNEAIIRAHRLIAEIERAERRRENNGDSA